MGPDLNCFEWNNQSSHYLDGSLPPEERALAEEHLSGCSNCRERLQHYRLILESLRGLRRVSTPDDLQSELETQAPRLALNSGSSLVKIWKASLQSPLKSPRTVGVLVVLAVGLGLLAALPKIRAFYESRLERQLDANNFDELPLSDGELVASSGGAPEDSVDDFASEYDDPEPAQGELSEAAWKGEKGSRSARPDVWRFILRTDSPQDLRAPVHRAIEGAGTLPGSKFANGFVAPGGVQFDVLIPQAAVEPLRQELSNILEQRSRETEQDLRGSSSGPYPTSPFTWYRNRSKRPLPAGAARVIVWLSLI